MKMSIRKLVAGFLICAVVAGSTPFSNFSLITVSQVQAASQETEDNLEYLQEKTPAQTTIPTQTPEVVTSTCVTATPTEGPMSTPFVEVFIQFIDGDNCNMGIARPQYDGDTTYVTVKIIHPYMIKEGYRFLGWENNSGLYQPGEEVKVCGEDGYAFYAKWEKVESITTPVATSTVTNGSATATPVVTTTEPEVTATVEPEAAATVEPEATVTVEPEATATVEPKATATETATAEPEATPTVTPIATETSNVDSPVKASEEGIEELEKKTNADTEKKEKGKKASLKIVTNANKKFVVGKRYRIKVK